MFKKRKYKMCSLPYITILLILHGNNHVFENSLINIEKKLVPEYFTQRNATSY